MMKVTVVGAGTMGHCIAQVFAQQGHEVFLNDISTDALITARKQITQNFKVIQAAGITEEDNRPESIQNRIRYTSDLSIALHEADLVIESIVEDPEAKRQLFLEMEAAAPIHAIFASNTSHLNVFSIAPSVRPKNMIIAHWFNPPHIMPLVEIVLGPETSVTTRDKVQNVLESLGKETIILKKYIPGFIGNRLQGALNLEFYHLLDSGLVSPEEIDRVVRLTFGLRLPLLGIAQRSDFTGLDLLQDVLANKSYNPPEVRGKCNAIDQLVSQGHLGVKTRKGFYDYSDKNMEDIIGDRDEKLMKLVRFLEDL